MSEMHRVVVDSAVSASISGSSTKELTPEIKAGIKDYLMNSAKLSAADADKIVLESCERARMLKKPDGNTPVWLQVFFYISLLAFIALVVFSIISKNTVIIIYAAVAFVAAFALLVVCRKYEKVGKVVAIWKQNQSGDPEKIRETLEKMQKQIQ